MRAGGWIAGAIWAAPGHENWSHMVDLYPQQVVKAHAEDVWQRSAVLLETCGTPLGWKDWGFALAYLLDQALRWHATSINIKSTTIPAEWRPQFEEFEKKIGYRFVLRRIDYPRRVHAGQMAMFRMWWLNAGVAPVYRDYMSILTHKAKPSALLRMLAVCTFHTVCRRTRTGFALVFSILGT
jgi:hypothetical protein